MVFYYQMIYFPETNNTIKHDSCYGYKYSNYYTVHNNTHSVHKRLLVMWRARLLCLDAFRYVYPPPLSEANCLPFPPLGGPGPPATKMAPFSPGSTHTLSTLSVTAITICTCKICIRVLPLIEELKRKILYGICKMETAEYIPH